jgi:hypothetical protein
MTDTPPVDEPDGSLRFYPWPELLKRQRREWIADRLIPVRGVTTLVGQPGEGKTTLAIALALSVATGAKFAGREIKQRPVIGIFGEGQEDSRPLYEAWIKNHPTSVTPEGAFHDGPLNLFEAADTDKLIAKLKAPPKDTPPPLFMLDALADMMPGGDEDRAKDMNRVYGNVWRVVLETGASFLIIHHAGWEGTREKGSIAIRAKSDIVVLVKLDQVGMVLNLTCLKNRRGPKFANIGFQVESVSVDGFDGEVLVATGVEVSATGTTTETKEKGKDAVREAKVAAFEVLVIAGRYTYNAWQGDTRDRLRVKTNNPDKGLGNSVFRDAVAALVDQGTVVKIDGVYQLGPGCTATPAPASAPFATPTPHSGPYRGPGVAGVGGSAPGVLPGSAGSGSNKSRKAENSVEKNEQPESDDAFKRRVIEAYGSLDHPQAIAMLEARAKQKAPDDTANVLASAAEQLIGKKVG